MQAKRIHASQWQPPDDALVLAAVDRADRHRSRRDLGVLLQDVAAHLDMQWGPHTSRRLRPIIDRLTDELGQLEHSRHQRRDYWQLTDAGTKALSRALLAGVGDELPESPQHRQWRAAREHASARIEGLKNELGERLAALNALLDAPDPPPATELLAFAEPVKELIEAVAIAHYCLYERAEPDDARADERDPRQPLGEFAKWRHPRMWDPGHDD